MSVLSENCPNNSNENPLQMAGTEVIELLSPDHNYRGNKFIMVHNNYSNEDIVQIGLFFEYYCSDFICAKEIGKTGTPHLQCAFITKKKMTYKQIMNITKIKCHFETMKGKWFEAWKYCIKEYSNTNHNICFSSKELPILKKDIPILEIKPLTNLYPWQKDIINIINTIPNDRTVYWIYDDTGNNGKTALTKHIYQEYNDVLIFSKGKANDIAYQICQSNFLPKLCIFDITRTMFENISYQALEEIKNGCINTYKYEGGFKIFPSPHLIVFSNSMPCIRKLTKDRWKIYTIENKSLYEFNINDTEIL